MRGHLASSTGVACAAALALPLLFAPSGAAVPPGPDVAGSTQSLPLRTMGRAPTDRAAGAVEQGLPQREVKPFSLVGVVWDDIHAELLGSVQIRTRAVATGAWSDWQEIETHNLEHAADPGTAESESGKVRGSTAPLWVGNSDAVEARVRAETAGDLSALPHGLRLELVDPGDDPWADEADVTRFADDTGEGDGDAGSPQEEGRAPFGALEIPALTRAETEAEAAATGELEPGAKPYIGPRPRIVTRRGWGADESLREPGFVYTDTVKAAFVHHTATGNNYTCDEAPSVLRSIYRYHVVSSGWRDFGYNFAVDKCGNIYEGRAGGVAKPVRGAHTLGFNTDSTGIAALGSYSQTAPPEATVTAIAKLTAWKLGLHGADPSAKTTLTSGGSGKYATGVKVKLNVISGHRDGFATDCPGNRLYDELGTARSASAKYQGRSQE
ncbi:peptidoglycan recognition protein [Streptomyces sp. NPDC006208]|uniref:peptidoglycan recognition protein family protein n=1 Tax=Streptomyces sp. NPDC006208 TaxID=3156734 RepID=UPI0033B1050F